NCATQEDGKRKDGPPDSCDRCPSCRKIDGNSHPDVTWVRPESKSRIIKVEQIRELIRTLNLKPTQAQYKVGIIVAADRLYESAANAFLKTLEEPPSRSMLALLTTAPSQLPETILSRCLRLNLAGDEEWTSDEVQRMWLTQFGEAAVKEQGSLLSRYRLLAVLLKKLAELKEKIAAQLEKQSPLEKYDDVEPELREKWEDELKAAVEAEYRRQRSELLVGLQWWLRDVWLQSLASGGYSLALPELGSSSQAVAKRILSSEAMENLRVMERTQGLLDTNIQEALALEVGLLKLKL
ncbi:MAG: hypothetical protein NTW03_04500, partial [Verrucomicrobia bacterium]|nr:hypothetical protein [Verrucomicrobiota bacterium]